MPPQIRELIAELEQAGFVDRGGKGSHRNFVHPEASRPLTISGKPNNRFISGEGTKHRVRYVLTKGSQLLRRRLAPDLADLAVAVARQPRQIAPQILV